MSNAPALEIQGLSAKVADEDTAILKDLDLVLEPGQIHAIMGPNGSGKSTLGKVLSGHPSYQVTGGEVLYLGQSILDM